METEADNKPEPSRSYEMIPARRAALNSFESNRTTDQLRRVRKLSTFSLRPAEAIVSRSAPYGIRQGQPPPKGRCRRPHKDSRHAPQSLPTPRHGKGKYTRLCQDLSRSLAGHGRRKASPQDAASSSCDDDKERSHAVQLSRLDDPAPVRVSPRASNTGSAHGDGG
jgi:hypothetical protein